VQTETREARKYDSYALACTFVFISFLPKMSWIIFSTSPGESEPLPSVSYRSNANWSVGVYTGNVDTIRFEKQKDTPMVDMMYLG